MKKTLLLAGVVSVFAFNVNAAEYVIQPYVGMDYVYSNADIKKPGGNKQFKDAFDSANFNIGVKSDKNIGVEVFYQKARHEDRKTTDGRTRISFDAVGVDALGYMPLTYDLNLIGTAGLGYYDFETKARTYSPVSGEENNHKGWGFRFGGGAEYDINEKFAVRGIARYVFTPNISRIDDMYELSAGIKYKF